MALNGLHTAQLLRTCVLSVFASLTLPAWAQAPTTTRVDLATPATYTAGPGSTVAITLNWYRVPMVANYFQFMHIVSSGGQTWSVDDHSTTSTTWASGAFAEARTITVPSTLGAGTYDVRVGLSGGNPWTDLALAVGSGVTDPSNDHRYKVGTITVSSAANVAPQIISTPVTSATLGVAYSYDVNATDANGDTLSYSLTQAPTGMTINAASGLIAWTPTSGQAGSQAVTARVADPGGLAVTQSLTVIVGGAANVAPQITSTPATSATVGVAYSYDVNATDANGDTLSYSLTRRPTGMTINAASGLIAWTPTSGQTGNRNVTARVADPGGLAVTQSFTISVASAANVAPQITSTPVTSATLGVAYSYDVNATDANGGTLSYSLTQAPTGMTINAVSGLIAWTPTSGQAGSQAVTARVADPGGLAVTQTFTVSVAGAANVAPQITSTPVTSATVGVAYSYRVSATDANGDTLSYSLTQAPTGLTINAASGQIAWTPTSGQIGSQAVTARVADPGGLSATQSFTVAVSSANVTPQIGNSWRIMPIGDSNTENLAAFPGYQTITQALSAIGKSSAVFGYVNPGEPNIVNQVTTAQIGRSGWSTTNIISQINGWVDQVTPDIVLLNIGVNDGYFPNDLVAQDAVVGRIATIIDMIHARNPRTAVFVSNSERASDSMPTMYSKIQQMVLAKAAIGPSIYYQVYFVPSLTGVLSTMYVSDGLHPNQSGRLIIMNNWMNGVRNYVQTGTVPAPATSTVPLTTRVDLATPSAYYALPGSRVNINLNWYRMPMSANLLQFMHLNLNGSIAGSVDDHSTTSATWTPGLFTETRTITAPTTLGTYDIRVGLSGGNPWTDFVLITGVGVLDETNSQTYKVGTITVTNILP